VPTATVQRSEVLRVLGTLINWRWRGLQPEDIPVQFMGKRIAVLLPASAFTADEQIKVEGKIQHKMARQGLSAFIDFVENWKGLGSKLDTGFN